jgi:hypothetical protein
MREEPHQCPPASDTDSLVFDERPKLRAQSLVAHQVHRTAEEVFQEELDTKVAIGRGGAIEGDEDVESLSCRAVPREIEPKSARSVTPKRSTKISLLRASNSRI